MEINKQNENGTQGHEVENVSGQGGVSKIMLGVLVGFMIAPILIMTFALGEDAAKLMKGMLMSITSPLLIGFLLLLLGRFDMSMDDIKKTLVEKKPYTPLPFKQLKPESKMTMIVGCVFVFLGATFTIVAIVIMSKSVLGW